MIWPDRYCILVVVSLDSNSWFVFSRFLSSFQCHGFSIGAKLFLCTQSLWKNNTEWSFLRCPTRRRIPLSRDYHRIDFSIDCFWLGNLAERSTSGIMHYRKTELFSMRWQRRTTPEVEKLRAKNQQIINKHLNSIEK